ncbi:hypothetical protein BHAMNSH16_03365 [Brachyspira hampsonii]|uniref:Uncharacterized protein n=1 Tax=Brachyspira hampsonii TaxID=1287055 RepID=A0AAC9TSM3_9SPIR|nr:hypothetical protein BHAMNSH16_03365 [Brachyspira hampsonii]
MIINFLFKNIFVNELEYIKLFILYNARCDAMRCDAMRCDAMRCDAMRLPPFYSPNLRLKL